MHRRDGGGLRVEAERPHDHGMGQGVTVVQLKLSKRWVYYEA
jgi:hypothetical protein